VGVKTVSFSHFSSQDNRERLFIRLKEYTPVPVGSLSNIDPFIPILISFLRIRSLLSFEITETRMSPAGAVRLFKGDIGPGWRQSLYGRQFPQGQANLS
jgi:hypothetical protein